MYFIIFDASGLAIGSGFSDNEILPEGAVTCDANDAMHYDRCRLVDGALAEAPPVPIAPPIASEVLAKRDALLAQAALRIAPLEDAIDLDVETAADVEALTSWKQYRVALNRIEQQAGFPADVEWPKVPE